MDGEGLLQTVGERLPGLRKAWSDVKLKAVCGAMIRYYAKAKDRSRYAAELAFLETVTTWPEAQLPYAFPKRYDPERIAVLHDPHRGLPYVLHMGKQLFFPRSMDDPAVQSYYNSLLIEQDPESPHRYLTDTYRAAGNTVLVDVGAAEGILALQCADLAKRIVLFEADDLWTEALNATFAPWKEKTQIVSKFVSNTNDGQNVSLDVFFAPGSGRALEPGDEWMIKLDVEGAEPLVLEGAKRLLETNPAKCLCCLYHDVSHESIVRGFFDGLGYASEFSRGYMLYTGQKIRPPYLRRVLLRANNESIGQSSEKYRGISD